MPTATDLRPRSLAAQLAWWKEQLAGGPDALELPSDRPRSAARNFRAAVHPFALPKNLADAADALSGAENVTVAATLLAAFQTLLHRYTGATDLIIGTPAAPPSTNTLALRLTLHGATSVREVLAHTDQTARDAFANQAPPFALVRADLPDGPVFQVAFALQPVAAPLLPNFKCELALAMTETSGGLEGRFHYNAELFDAENVQRMAGHFQMLLEAMVADPARPISLLPLLTEAERRQLLVEWNQTAAPFSRETGVQQLFEAQVERTPDAIAAVCGDQQITYRELNRRANQLAHHLRGLGVGPDVIVGLGVERSLDLVVALLSVLKAGGAYLYLDAAYPKERLEYMARDAGLKVFLMQQSLASTIPLSVAQVKMDSDSEKISRESAANPENQTTGAHLAYAIYTSGSTGQPKGVLIRHDAFSNVLTAMQREPGLTAQDAMLALTTLSFDISNLEIFLPLITGGRTIIASREAATDSALLLQTLARAGATILQATSATFQLLREAGWAGDRRLKIISGGEALGRDLADWLLERCASLWNYYGPTETTIYSTGGQVLANEPVTIGRPVANTQTFILNSQLQPVPIGVPGELHLGGAGLARGYQNQPELTSLKFIPDPFSAEPGARLYKTGDLARFRADGSIDYLGRIDHQVKVRGYRIELGEIESVLARHPAIRQAVVIVREDTPDDKRIVAYLVPGATEAPPVGELRQLAARHLPAYMVPGSFVFLATFPLTASGKVNRRALPAPADFSAATAESAPPRTPLEETLTHLWCEVLGRKQAGLHENFFETGGHSLLAMRLISQVRDTWQIELSLRNLFETPTIAGLATGIEALRQTTHATSLPPLRATARTGPLPVSLAQQRVWFLDRLQPGNPAYNMPMELSLQGPLHLPALEKSLGEILRRHESLRTVFPAVDGQPTQVIVPATPFHLTLHDLRALAPAARTAEQRRRMQEEALQIFNLESGPLFRGQLLRLDDKEHLLLLTMHHIVSDGWSFNILLDELGALYNAFRQDQPSPLPELPVQYVDFARWQRASLHGEAFARQVAYWKEELSGHPPVLELPADFPRPTARTYRGHSMNLLLPPALAEAAAALSRRENTTLFMTLLTVFQVLMHRLSGQEDILVGSPSAGRNRSEVERLIGFFVNVLVLRNNFSATPTFRQALARTRETALGAFSNQDVPFDRLVEELQPARDLSHSAIFQVMFNLLNLDERSVTLEGLAVRAIIPQEPGSKFDLSLYVEQKRAGVELQLVYNTDLFAPERMSELLQQFVHLLEQMVARPDRLVDRFSLVTPASEKILPNPLEKISVTPVKTAHAAFFEQAARTPENIALASPNGTCTYGELAAHANRLAHKLRADGAGPGDLVAIYAHRSPALVWAMLATLQSGAAFVILDPAYPEARLLEGVRLAKPRGWLQLGEAGAVPAALAEFARASGCRPLTLPPLERAADFLAEFSATPPEISTDPDALAYVAFTSGSTGAPKGIAGTHQPLAHFLQWHCEQSAFTAADRFSLLSGLAHDPLLRDVFTPLRLGATLCVPDSMESSQYLVGWFEREKISVSHLTPQMARLLTDGTPAEKQLPSLRHAFFGGDILTRSVLAKFQALAPSVQCVNFYGATETPQAMGFYPVPKSFTGVERLPVGRGIADVQLLVVNRAGERAGVGEPGEIFIRTPCLARGYLGDAALTAEKFVPNPITRAAADRCYQTGDLGRYRPDGNVEFLGRGDRQLKLRGFRIEPGEIESALARHPEVQSAVVLLHEERLVAWVVARPGAKPEAAGLREFVAGLVPQYMVPGAFVTIDALPLTPNGKLDTEALRRLGPEAAPAGARMLPWMPLQVQILRIWEELLPGRVIGLRDNFFELGGHSLLAVRLMDRLEQECGRKLPLAVLFAGATVEELAAKLVQQELDEAKPLIELQTGGTKTPFFFLHGDLVGGGFYTQKVSRHLGPDQPFFAIPPYPMETDTIPSIEELAAGHVRTIREHRPHGPYLLGGYCAAGLIAFEISRQLRAAGETVEHLVLIDSPPNIGYRRHARPVIDRIGSWRGIHCEAKLNQLYKFASLEERWLRIADGGLLAQLRFVAGRVASRFRRGPKPMEQVLGDTAAANPMEASLKIYAAYVWSVAGYRPRRYDGAATLLWAADQATQGNTEIKRWRELIPKLEITIIPGDHLTSVTQHAAQVAEHLRVSFSKTRPR